MWDDVTPIDPARVRGRWADQWSFTAPFEGIVPHLYLDSEGLPTCGVGFLVQTEHALLQLPWKPNGQAALADYRTVRVAERGHSAAFYARFCNASLSEMSMRAIFTVRVSELRKALQVDWQLARAPVDAQLALVDMAYNLGVGGLREFVNLRTAVLARDWATAAQECTRKKIQPARNAATVDLFKGLAEAPRG